MGHDINTFVAQFPDLTGRLILQDLALVIDDVDKQETKPDTKIERFKYDFFTPQPVKGTTVHYMRTVNHDWPDRQALNILKNTRDAVDHDSVLLIKENTLPDVGTPPFLVKAGRVMMSLLSALDRTAKQYKSLPEKAGFEVRGPWKSDAVDGVGMVFAGCGELAAEASKNATRLSSRRFPFSFIKFWFRCSRAL